MSKPQATRARSASSPGPASADLASGPLLSPEHAAARSHPLRCWSAGDRARLAQAVATAAQGWQEAWNVQSDSGAVARTAEDHAITCDVASDAAARWAAPDLAWEPLDGAGWGAWWTTSPSTALSRSPSSRRGAALLSSLSRALFGEPAPGGSALDPDGVLDRGPTVASEIVQAAWRDWWTRIAAVLDAGDATASVQEEVHPPPEALRPWSGALVVTIPWWDEMIVLLVAGERVEQFLGAAATGRSAPNDAPHAILTPLWRALARRTTRLRAQTWSFELDLGTLAALRVGDVLRTAHGLDSPLTVNVAREDGAAGPVLCTGFLGRSGSVRAVELMPRGTATSPPADQGDTHPTTRSHTP